jgi:hypothetical protein
MVGGRQASNYQAIAGKRSSTDCWPSEDANAPTARTCLPRGWIKFDLNQPDRNGDHLFNGACAEWTLLPSLELVLVALPT